MRKNEANWIESRQRWQINVQKDGERKTFSSSTLGTKGKIEAERKADKWLSSDLKDTNIRFSTLYEEFLKEKRELTSYETYKKHEQMGRLHLIPGLKHKRVTSITEQDWQECINTAYKKGLSKKSLRNIRASITAFCKFARKQGLGLHNPEFLEIPKNAIENEKTILQPDDLITLMNNDAYIHYGIEKHDFYIHAYRFIVLTGLRRGELCALKNENIKDGIVYVAGSVNRFNEETRGKNANAKRWFALNRYTLAILEQQKETLKKHGIISAYVFPDIDGNRLDPNIFYKRWYRYRRHYNIISSLHELRHTFISIAKADVPEPLLKGVAGHSKSMDTLGIYGHSVKGEAERTADILSVVFCKILGEKL